VQIKRSKYGTNSFGAQEFLAVVSSFSAGQEFIHALETDPERVPGRTVGCTFIMKCFLGEIISIFGIFLFLMLSSILNGLSGATDVF
jgi:hypothetical protein